MANAHTHIWNAVRIGVWSEYLCLCTKVMIKLWTRVKRCSRSISPFRNKHELMWCGVVCWIVWIHAKQRPSRNHESKNGFYLYRMLWDQHHDFMCAAVKHNTNEWMNELAHWIIFQTVELLCGWVFVLCGSWANWKCKVFKPILMGLVIAMLQLMVVVAFDHFYR